MNFVFFVPDELRAESVGCYGHPLVRTPNMDRLANQGTRFDQCHVQHTVCSPSRCSYMTGWYPHVRGHRSLWHLLQPDEPNLLRYLKEAGYYIYWNGGHNDVLAPECFADSVDEYHNSGGSPFGHNPFETDDPRARSFLYTPYEGDLNDHGDVAKVRAAIDFLKSGPQQPFVIYLPLIYPHPPYCAPPQWHSMYTAENVPPLRPAESEGKPNFHQLIRETRRLGEVDQDFLRQINAVYLGMTSLMDDILGEFLDALEATGQDANTAMFFFADHGDYAGDYGLVEKWPSGLEDVLTRVPLLIRAPGMKAGHVVEEPVELFDIMPTVLELAGIEARHNHFARSLVPQLEGAPGDPQRVVFAEGGYNADERYCLEGSEALEATIHPDDTDHPMFTIYGPKNTLQQVNPDTVCRSVMARTSTHKFIYRSNGQHELYDLTTDPEELHNISGTSEGASVQQCMERTILDWYLRTADVTPWHEDPRGLPPGGNR